MLYTKWSQVEDWIRDNGLTRWTFSVSNPNKREERLNDKLVDSQYYPETLDEKLAITHKILNDVGHCFGVGFHDQNGKGGATVGGMFCEVDLSQTTAQPTVGYAPAVSAPMDEAALEEKVRKRLELDYQKKELDRIREEFERERKEYQAAKEGVVGMLIGYLKPVAEAFMQKRISGLDATEPVHAAPITTEQPAVENDTAEENVFTDEESDRLYDLMARFKKAEPQYLQLLEAVVAMAESGDSTYTMAKSVLIK